MGQRSLGRGSKQEMASPGTRVLRVCRYGLSTRGRPAVRPLSCVELKGSYEYTSMTMLRNLKKPFVPS